MTVDFGKPENAAPVPSVVVEKTEVETPVPGVKVETITSVASHNESSSVPAAPSSSGIPLGDDLPGFRDVIFPRLNIVQNIGELKNSFRPGEVVFGQATVLFTPPVVDAKTGNVKEKGTGPTNITVIGIVLKRFSEKIEGGIGGQICNTEAEVRQAGGTLDYKEWELKKKDGMRRFEPMIDMLVAIKRPEHVKDDDTVFNFVVGADKYALGLWTVKGTSYTNAFKKVLAFQRLAGILKAGYWAFSFNLSSREEKYRNGNCAWIPILVPAQKSSEDFLAFVRQIVSPTA